MADEDPLNNYGRHYYLRTLELEKVIAILMTKLELHERTDLNEELRASRKQWIERMEKGVESMKILYEAARYL